MPEYGTLSAWAQSHAHWYAFAPASPPPRTGGFKINQIKSTAYKKSRKLFQKSMMQSITDTLFCPLSRATAINFNYDAQPEGRAPLLSSTLQTAYLRWGTWIG